MEVVYLQCCLAVTWLQQPTCAMWNCCHLGTFCVLHTTMHYITSLHTQPHIYGVCVFSCNLPPTLLAEWLGSFTDYCSNKGLGPKLWPVHTYSKWPGSTLILTCGTYPSTMTSENCDLDMCILALGTQVAEVWSKRYRLLEMPSVVTEPR